MSSNPSAFTATPASIGAAPASALPWQPSDSGLLAASGVLDAVGSQIAMVAGTLYLLKVPVRTAFTWTNMIVPVGTAGVGASTGSFAGLYSSAGLLLSGSADIGASLLAIADISVPLTTPQPLAAGSFVWAALLANLATSQPSIRTWAAQSSFTANLGVLSPAVMRCGTAGTGLTALPASITPAANTPAAVPFFIGAN